MAVDLAKLARIQEQAMEMRGALRLGGERARARTQAANQHRLEAVRLAEPALQTMPLRDLLQMDADARVAGGVDARALEQAEREQAVAQQINESTDRKRQEWAGFLSLVPRLERYAGVKQEG